MIVIVALSITIDRQADRRSFVPFVATGAYLMVVMSGDATRDRR